MYQLIITLISILLVSALLLTTVSYLPWWKKPVEEISESVKKSMANLENSFFVVSRSNDGNVPAQVGTASDGGLQQNFGAILKFTPYAPGGYSWVYNVYPTDGSIYSGLGYFCLKPNNPSEPMNIAVYKAMAQVKAQYPKEQVLIVNSITCNESTYTGIASQPSSAGSVVFFMNYIPGPYLQ